MVVGPEQKVITMQMPLSFAADQRFPEVLNRLKAAWPPREEQHADPLSQLVFMLVSADTPSAIALAAYRRLRSRYHGWPAVRDEAPEVLLRVLRGIDKAVEKAVTLPRLLQEIEDRHGLLELEFLAGWTTQAAREWLEALPGVDAMISTATLNFSTLRKTVLALDPEGARVVRRFGFVAPAAPMSALDRQIMDKIPASWQAKEMSSLYSGIHKLAGTYCHKGRPKCAKCPLNDLCPTSKKASAAILQFPSKSQKAVAATSD